MAGIRDILKGPPATLKSIEAKLPAGLPSLADTLAGIAAKLPEGPALPKLGGGGGQLGEIKLPKLSGIVESVEELLPTGAPKFSSSLRAVEGKMPGAKVKAEEIPPAPKKPPQLYFE